MGRPACRVGQEQPKPQSGKCSISTRDLMRGKGFSQA